MVTLLTPFEIKLTAVAFESKLGEKAKVEEWPATITASF